jgi:hypothetical protein
VVDAIGITAIDDAGVAYWVSAGVQSRLAGMNDGNWHSAYWHIADVGASNWRLWSSVDGGAVVDHGIQSLGSSGFVGTAVSTNPTIRQEDGSPDASLDEPTLWFGASRWTNHQAASVQTMKTSGWLLTTYTDHVQSAVSGFATLVLYGPKPKSSGINLFLKANDLFDEDHAVFYHPVDDSREWTKHQSWNSLYQSVTGKVGNGMRAVLTDLIAVQSGQIGFSGYTTGHPWSRIVGLSQDRSISMFVDYYTGNILRYR